MHFTSLWIKVVAVRSQPFSPLKSQQQNGASLRIVSSQFNVHECEGLSGVKVLLGTPETRRRGRSTRKARRALTSNPPGLPPDWPPESASLVIISRTTLNNLATVDGEEDETMSGGEGVGASKQKEKQRTKSSLWLRSRRTVPSRANFMWASFMSVWVRVCVHLHFSCFAPRHSLQWHPNQGPTISTCARLCVCVGPQLSACPVAALTADRSCTDDWRLTCAVFALHLWKNSPDDDDDKVQHVPAVSHVGVLVHDQAVGNDLQKCLYCENDQEGIFDCFLWGGEANGRGESFKKMSWNLRLKNFHFRPKQVQQKLNKEKSPLVIMMVAMATGFLHHQCPKNEKNVFGHVQTCNGIALHQNLNLQNE